MDVEIYVLERFAFVGWDRAVAQNAVVQDRQGASVLVADISGEALVGDLVELEADVIDRVAAVTIGRYYSTVVVESELVFEAVTKGRLVEGHVGLEQFEVQRHEEAVSIRVGDGLVDGIVLSVSCADTKFGRVSVGSSVNSLVLGVPERLDSSNIRRCHR